MILVLWLTFLRLFCCYFFVEFPDHPCDYRIRENTSDNLSVSPDYVRDTLAALSPNLSIGQDGVQLCIPDFKK